MLRAGIERRAAATLGRTAAAFSTIKALSKVDGDALMELSFRLAGADAREATQAEGYAAYGGALPGATLLSRVSGEGIEDYVYFERAPGAAEVRYELELSDEVAGLRLVGGSLEALDASGAPRLRIAPPFLIDAQRTRAEADLRLEGCAADTSPAAPWDRPVTPPGARHCTVVIAWDDAAVAYPALLDPSWSTTGSMASARAYHTATYLPTTGKILAVGGIGSGGAPIATAELYNPAGAGTWAATDSVPTTGVGRAYHTAVVLNDNTVFVAGGYRDGTNTTNTSAIYTPSTGHWAGKAQMTTARGKHAATVLTTGEVVVTGGISGTTSIQNVEVYRPTGANANTWFQANSPTSARRTSHASVRMQSGDVMIIGGRDGSTTLNTVFSYNLAANAWTARGTLSEPRVGHTATVMSSGNVLVAGGGPFNSTTVVATCDLYNKTTNTWSPTADMATARTGHSAVLQSDDSIVVSGGIGPGSSALAVKTAERFKSAFETWMPEPSLLTARAYHTTTVTPSSGTIVAAGGITKTSSPTYLSSSERYTPVFPLSFASDYFDGAHAVWSPDLPEVNAPGDPNGTTRVTELKGTMYYPTIGAGQVFPVVVMLHGNRNSCGHSSNPRLDSDNTYASTGACPSGFTEVRGDKGFAYVAHELAKLGFIVFSIDANRGIAGLDNGAPPSGDQLDTRGRLVLKTLQHMSKWNSGALATPSGLPSLLGHLDLHNVGLLGHSRGGEGVRAAASFYANDPTWQSAIPNLRFKGIFEIGSTDTDFGDGIDYDDGNIPWALLMGTCDTNAFCLEEDCPARTGLMTFDRLVNNAVGFVGEYAVWGANHNYYNSEWQMSDLELLNSDGSSLNRSCQPGPIYQPGGVGSGITGSAKQRQTAVYTVTNFMLGTVPATADLSQLSIFDSAQPAPPAIKVSRAHTANEGTRFPLEDFHNDFPQSSTFGVDNEKSSAVTVEQAADGLYAQIDADHLHGLPCARVTWSTASSSNFFQVNWAPAGSGDDFSGETFFEFRIERDNTNLLDPPTNFSLRLVNGDGSLSNAVQISTFTSLTGPSGMLDGDSGTLVRPFPFGTVRIPLPAFTGANLSSLRGAKFIFDQSASGPIFMTNVRMESD